MKKTILILTTVLLLLCSCTIRHDLFYYGYFGDSAFVVSYSVDKNTVYKIDLPLNTLVEWGTSKGYNSMKDIMQDFVGIQQTAFIAGTPENHRTISGVVNSIAGYEIEDPEERLAFIVLQTDAMKDQEFMEKINMLCSADLTDLVQTIVSEKPDTCYIDSGTFLMDDPDMAQKYFRQWIGQII